MQGVTEEHLGDRGQFRGVHPIGFQRMVDQQLALHAVAGEVAGQQHHGGGECRKYENQRAQIQAQAFLGVWQS